MAFVDAHIALLNRPPYLRPARRIVMQGEDEVIGAVGRPLAIGQVALVREGCAHGEGSPLGGRAQRMDKPYH